jgi:di/tricarboxylate transporter
MTFLGLTYLLTIAPRLLPKRRGTRDVLEDEAREYLVELEVDASSPLDGVTVEKAGLRSLPGLFLVEIRRRHGLIISPVAPQDLINRHDHLVFTGLASTVESLIEDFPGLRPVDAGVGLAERSLFEVVISHRSDLLGRSVKDSEFRRRFDAAILAIHRAGERVEGKIGHIVLMPGDTLMLSASPGFRAAWQNSPAFYLVSALGQQPERRWGKARLAMAVILGLVVVPAATDVPMLVSAMGALVLLVLTGCIGLRGAREAINWSVLVLIGSAFGVAKALDASGAATLLGTMLLDSTSALGPRATLAGVYIGGVVVASFISNSAAAALLFPIAMTAAHQGGFDVRPFAMALALAASAGFSTPIGCQPNLLVYGPGGYRYLDFTRVGLPLNLLFLVVALVLIPLVWPF